MPTGSDLSPVSRELRQVFHLEPGGGEGSA